jgi:hypothetical protein
MKKQLRNAGFLLAVLMMQSTPVFAAKDRFTDYATLNRKACATDVTKLVRATLVSKVHKNCLNAGLGALQNAKPSFEFEYLKNYMPELRKLIYVMVVYKLDGQLPPGYDEKNIEVMKEALAQIVLSHKGGIMTSQAKWEIYKKEHEKDLQVIFPAKAGISQATNGTNNQNLQA